MSGEANNKTIFCQNNDYPNCPAPLAGEPGYCKGVPPSEGGGHEGNQIFRGVIFRNLFLIPPRTKMPGRFGISFRKQPGRLFHFTLFAESASAGVKHELTGLRQHLLGFGLRLGIRLWLRFRMFEAFQPGIHLLSAAVSPGWFGLVLAVRSSRRTGQSDVEMGGVSPPGTDLSQPGAIIIGMGLFAGIFLYRRAHKNALHPVVAGGIPEQGVGISVHVLVDAEQVVVNHRKRPGLGQLLFGETFVILDHPEPDIHLLNPYPQLIR